MMANRRSVLQNRNESTLALAIEPELIRACLIDAVGSEHRLTAWITVQRDLHAALSGQIGTICQRLGKRMGRELWDETGHRPLLGPRRATHLPYLGNVTAAVNPRSPLRIWLVALSAQVSLAAARQAVVATPTEIVGETLLNTTLTDKQLAADLARARPDTLVIVGGHDDKESEAQLPLLTTCKIVGKALGQLPADAVPLVLFAGNRWAAEPVVALLREENEQQRIEVVSNVRPASNSISLSNLAQSMQREHWRLSHQLLGIASIGQWVTEPARLTALDWSFAQLVRAWMEYHGLTELYGIYRAHHWHQHVWARSGHDVVRMIYAEPAGPRTVMDGWPSPQLLSGAAQEGELPPTLRWWDRSGMAPMVATLGQISPAAMLQVLHRDLFGL